MSNWIKYNNTWKRSTNNINIVDFNDSLKPTDKLNIAPGNSAIVYIPTHNIRDVYEWYRIFNDSYAFTDNFDKYGFGIHGWFSKERGQSIEGWFPNLIEVKATSTDILNYYNIGSDYFRSSNDYLQTFNSIDGLMIDNVRIYDGEKILLRNQFTEQLSMYSINTTLSINNLYYIQIISGDEQYFKIGDQIVFKTINNEFITDTITLINMTQVNGDDYLVIKTINEIVDIDTCGSIESGMWVKVSYEEQNGVYEYINSDLVAISEMTDKYKTYGQIIYTYQGETNQNKEFYLRRNEDKQSTRYSLYPIQGIAEPLIYSIGDAYLIKCELDYSLNIDASDIINVETLASCCACIANINTNVPNHPTGLPPYDIDTDPFRLLMLDNTVAEKVFSTNSKGIGVYKTDPIIDMGDCNYDILFATIDKDGNNNVFINHSATEFYNSPIAPIYDFYYVTLGINEVLNVTFTEVNTISVSPSTNSTQFAMTYDGIDYLTDEVTAGTNGQFINMKLSFVIDGVSFTALDQQFIIKQKVTQNSTDYVVDVYPILDINMINDLNAKIALGNLPGNSIEFDVSFVNTWGTFAGSTIEDRATNLITQINKSIIGEIYDLSTTISDLSNQVTLEFNGIRRDTRYKWENLGVEVTTFIDTYYIEHMINNNYRPYFYGYNSFDYLNGYLGMNNVSFGQLIPSGGSMTFTYSNIAESNTRVGIEGSNKIVGAGNIIYFGSDYKEQILDYIKRNTYIYVEIPEFIGYTVKVWVSDVEWLEIDNVVKITTLTYIYLPTTGNDLIIYNDTQLLDISNNLTELYDKKINSISDPNFHYNAYNETVAYKPDTASYAYSMLQYGWNGIDKTMEVYNNISGILYKDFNEPRISFTKRDRTFPFMNNERIQVNAASTTNIDLILIPGTIDSMVLVDQNIYLFKDQIDPTENGIYLFDLTSTQFIRYDGFNSTTYWEVLAGVINIGKSYQANYDLPFSVGTSEIQFLEKQYRTKKDNRLTLKPIEIGKLGVDNDTQPWIKINKKYDTQELEENLLIIEPGINAINKIRFIDGLTEFNILNDINEQGQYIWILGENVITENAVVGCTQEFGPGTGDLIWYTGTWVTGTWCNGIWIQGLWKEGTWVNGTWNAYPIQDYYYYIPYVTTTNNLLSTWESGTWINGTFAGGIVENINWINGIFTGGVIKDGNWLNGTFINGIIKHIIWENGTFNGGDFETGIWKSGILTELDPTIPARFGTGSDVTSDNYKDRAIWIKGIFDSGQFHSGDNTNHNGSIFYGGTFISADWYGGSFICGDFQNSIWYNGVYFGGYNITLIDGPGSEKIATFTPDQYDEILGLTILTGYVVNIAHNIHTHTTSFYLLGTPTIDTLFTDIAFINQWDEVYTSTYQTKPYIIGSETDTLINLEISTDTVGTTVYVASNPGTNTPSGEPMICTGFVGIWKSGIWLNGYFKSGTWETGSFINGYAADIVFGLI